MFWELHKRNLKQPLTLQVMIWAALLTLSATGCSDSGTETSRADEIFVTATPEPDLLPTEEDLRDRFEGTVAEPDELLIGTCFNQYSYLDRNDLPAQLTTAVGCSRPHNAQVYAISIHPAPTEAPYPGEETLNQWGQQQCYKKFEQFVGEAYEKSQLEIGIISPDRNDWGGDEKRRNILCFVYSYEGLLIVGNMQNIAL